MQVAAHMNQTKLDVFRWRCALGIPMKLALALGFAAITGLLAQVRLPLPWSPVPITGQTFGVLLAGVMLGRWWGGISMALYMTIGAAGVPWFNGAVGGLAVLAGPTGGYLFGFVLAALFLGHFTDKYVRSRSFVSMLGLMLFADFVLIFAPGLAQLGLWLHLVEGLPAGVGPLLAMGLFPFIVGDVTKIVIAAAIARAATPKRA